MELDPDLLKLTLRVQGYAIVPGAFPAETLGPLCEAMSRRIDRWYGGEREDPDFWWFKLESFKDPILYRIHNLEKKNEPTVQRLLDSATLRQVVEAAFEGSAEATECALIVKIPRQGAEVPWHRDPICVPPCTVYNFSIFLDDAQADTGCLEFLPRSHFFPPEHVVAKQRPEGSVPLAAAKGDVVIHDARILHGSAWNITEKSRRSIVVEYHPHWLQSLVRRGLVALRETSGTGEEST